MAHEPTPEEILAFTDLASVMRWAQLPGEPLEQGSARIEYMANNVLPAVRANLA